jgi:nucleoside 2-deoxyribosyltransferase
LSGPIEYDTSGFDWRPAVKEQLVNRFELSIFDPFTDPKQSKADELNLAKESEDYDTVAAIAEDFVHKDLGWVDRSDMLIANLPYRVPTVGTIHEITTALNRKIPTILVCTQGKKYLPSWLFGLFKKKHKNFMYGSWDELFQYLEEVKDRKHLAERRWSFIYGLV